MNRNLQLDVGGNTEISWLDEARGLLLCTLEREGGAGNLSGSAEGESMVAIIDAVVVIDAVVMIDAVVVIRRCFWSTVDTGKSLLIGSLCDWKCSQKPALVGFAVEQKIPLPGCRARLVRLHNIGSSLCFVVHQRLVENTYFHSFLVRDT